MSALLIVKTANGFAAMPFNQPIATTDLAAVHTFVSLDGSYSYKHDGLLDHIKEHFTKQAITGASLDEPAVDPIAGELL